MYNNDDRYRKINEILNDLKTRLSPGEVEEQEVMLNDFFDALESDRKNHLDQIELLDLTEANSAGAKDSAKIIRFTPKRLSRF